MKIWLDDIRPCPDASWTRTFSAWDTIELLSTEVVEEISLDHDLGEASGYGMNDHPGTGYDVCLWMAEHQKFPAVCRVHSANPVGKARMLATINRYKPA